MRILHVHQYRHPKETKIEEDVCEEEHMVDAGDTHLILIQPFNATSFKARPSENSTGN